MKDFAKNTFAVIALLAMIAGIVMSFSHKAHSLSSTEKQAKYAFLEQQAAEEADDIDYEHQAPKTSEKAYKKPANDTINKTLTKRDDDEIVDMIEDAASEDDWTTVKTFADKIFALDNWHTNVSEEVQSALLKALADFMPKSFPELLNLIASSYEDVHDDALDEIKQAIDECDDEAEMANLIVKLSGVIDDEDFIESMVIEIDMFEPDNAATAMIGILKNGSSAFKKALADEIEEITDQKEFSEQAILKWLESEKADDE